MFLHWSSSSELPATIWSQFDIGETDDFVGIVRFGSYWVALTDTGTVWYSTDGSSWSSASTGMTNCDRLFLGNGVVVAEYTGGISAELKYSSNLTTWTSASNLLDLRTHYLNGVYYQYNTGSNNAQKSTDLSSWTTFTSAMLNPREALYENSLYVAITSVEMWSSTDGETWTDRTPTPAPDTPGNESLAYGSGVWVVAGEYTDDAYFRSTNGTSWTEIDTNTNGPENLVDAASPEVIYTNSQFYAVDTIYDIANSTDAALGSWTAIDLDQTGGGIGSGESTITVASDGTQLIGVGGGGLIARYVL